MRILLTAAALTLVVACTLSAETGQTASVRGCQAVATAPWRPLSGAEFTIEAHSHGPDCERAVATLSIRDGGGRVLWTDARPTAQVMTLAEARDGEALRRAMAEWVDAANAAMPATGALPDWPAGADGPVSGEFPFYPEPHFDRDAYQELRQRNAPMFCYVQGMESLACVALNQGGVEKVGVQTFPG